MESRRESTVVYTERTGDGTMKGYRKISSGCIVGCSESCEKENGYMDDQIRYVVHSFMIEEMQKSGTEEFYVVVYKKVS